MHKMISFIKNKFFCLFSGRRRTCFVSGWRPPLGKIQVYILSEQEDKLWPNALKIEETTEIRDNRVSALHLIF